jgi:uncharacterized RDD family membrane protein YckC
MVLLVLCLALAEEFHLVPMDDPGTVITISVIFLVLVWLYHAGLEASPMQGTLGKRMSGIKVINLSGRRCGMGQTSIRFFGKLLSAALLGAGFFMIAFSRRRQGLHDVLAGSLVVKR